MALIDNHSASPSESAVEIKEGPMSMERRDGDVRVGLERRSFEQAPAGKSAPRHVFILTASSLR